MIKQLLVFIVFPLFFFGMPDKAIAQELKYCGSVEAMEKFLKEHPELREKAIKERQDLEEHTQKFIVNKSAMGRASSVYIIPVVFHIVHNFGPENISDEQVKDAVRILNEDFRKLNADTVNIINDFKAIAGDSEIEFRLAQKDPFGNCTNGIDRIHSLETYLGENSSKLNPWPGGMYLNIWVVNAISSGAAGYAYYPANWTGSIDGIMILSGYVGSIGTGTPGRSRALTHEVGHYLNLKHTWGNSNNVGLNGIVSPSNPDGLDNCNDDDDVSDTPNTRGWSSCNLSGTTCGSLDNVQNYMDYSYCCMMFSIGQGTRMQAALNSSIAQRNNLWTAGNLNATGTNGTDILCKAEFSAGRIIICPGETINFTDDSYNGVTSRTWFFQGGSPFSSSLQSPSITYSTPGTYDVHLFVDNGLDFKSSTKTGYVTVLPDTGRTSPLAEGFETVQALPDNNWFISNPDDLNTWSVVSGVAASGNRSLKLENEFNQIKQTDEFISTTVDLSALPAVNLTFKMAYAPKTSTDNDILKVYVSNNCGQTWIPRWAKSSSLMATAPAQSAAFTPNASQWAEITITNISSSYLVEDFRFKFQFTSGGGNSIYIDGINLYDPATTAVSEVFSPDIDFMVFPNPVEESSVISFHLMEQQNVFISITDVLGRTVSIINNSSLNAGEHRFNLNNKNRRFVKGIYLIKIIANDQLYTKKVVVH